MFDGLRDEWGEPPVRWVRGPRAVAGAWFWLMGTSLLTLLFLTLTVFSAMTR